MGIFDQAFDAVVNTTTDLVSDADMAMNGEPGQLIADGTLSVLGTGDTGDLLRQESGELIDYTIDYAQGEPVELEADPNFVSDFTGAVIEDVGNIVDVATDLFGL